MRRLQPALALVWPVIRALPEGAALVLANPWVQASMATNAGIGCYVNYELAQDAYAKGDMAAYGDSMGNSVLCGLGAAGSVLAVGSNPNVRGVLGDIWERDAGNQPWLDKLAFGAEDASGMATVRLSHCRTKTVPLYH